jgi:hypothetical protein
VRLNTRLVGHLTSPVGREEYGIFERSAESGEYSEEVAALEGEHRDRIPPPPRTHERT